MTSESKPVSDGPDFPRSTVGVPIARSKEEVLEGGGSKAVQTLEMEEFRHEEVLASAFTFSAHNFPCHEAADRDEADAVGQAAPERGAKAAQFDDSTPEGALD